MEMVALSWSRSPFNGSRRRSASRASIYPLSPFFESNFLGAICNLKYIVSSNTLNVIRHENVKVHSIKCSIELIPSHSDGSVD
jgi:hypothetical protein